MNRRKLSRVALASTTTGFVLGLAFLNGGPARSIGGLCNGEPATHTWLDASGQYGPSLIDGTDGDDTIIGSDGDDHIDGGAGDDVICGGAGHNHIHGAEGNDALLGAADHDHLDGGEGNDTIVGFGGDDTVAGGPGCDVLLGGGGDDVMISTDTGHSHGGGTADPHAGGHGHDAGHLPCGDEGPPHVDGGHGHADGGHGHGDEGHGHADGGHGHADEGRARELDVVWAGDGFDVCFFTAGDELIDCEY